MKEEKVIGSKLLDSSIWIAYVVKKEHTKLIDSEDLLSISILSFFEIKKKLLKDGLPKQEVEDTLSIIKKRVIFILPITEFIAEKAAELSIENNLSAVDSLIYTSSLVNNVMLYTLDNDFRGLKNTVVFNK